jgi:Protein of unknown function (DUF4230)
MIRSWTRIGILALLIIGSIFIWEKIKKFSPWSDPELQTTHHQVLQKITSLGKLELVKYNFKDIVEQEIVQQLLPNPKALLIIEGEAVGCIDLRNIKSEDVLLNSDTLIVNLPKPEICYYKIDHQKSKIYETSFAFMNEEILLNEAFKKAEAQVLNGAISNGILENTKKNARLILTPILETISKRPVKVSFALEGQIQKLR